MGKLVTFSLYFDFLVGFYFLGMLEILVTYHLYISLILMYLVLYCSKTLHEWRKEVSFSQDLLVDVYCGAGYL